MGPRSPDWLLGKEAGQREGAAGTEATPPSGCHCRGRTQAARSSGALAEVSPPGAGSGRGGAACKAPGLLGRGRPQLRATVAGCVLLSHVLSPNLHPREVCKALGGRAGRGMGGPIL